MQPSLLLIEDDPLSQDLFRSLCESRGFAVDLASDGFTGLRMLKDGAHALALVDYHLPEMDGYALARLMRDLARPNAGPLTLIAITADRLGLLARRGSDALFDAVLAKPVVPAELFALLDRFSGAPSLRRAADALTAAPTPDRARSFSEALWREEGLHGRPRALVHPAPSAAERDTLACAFEIVDEGEVADLVLVLTSAPPSAGAGPFARADGARLPTVDLSGTGLGDAAFRVGDRRTWTDVARLVGGRAPTSEAGAARPASGIGPRAAAPDEAPLRAPVAEPAPGAVRLDPPRGPAPRTAVAAVAAGGAGRERAGAPATITAKPGTTDVPAGDAARRGRPRVLLIECDRALRECAHDLLSRADVAVSAAANLVEAVALLDAHRVDLVLLGEALPSLDAATGRAILRTLRGAGAEDLSVALLAADPANVPPGAHGAEAGFAGVAVVSEPGFASTVARLCASGCAPILDAGTLAGIRELLAPELVGSLLDRLLEQLDASFVGDLDRGELVQQAHNLISAAGMLGFVDLAERCRRLEEVLRAGGNPEADLDRVCDAVTDAAQLIARMRRPPVAA